MKKWELLFPDGHKVLFNYNPIKFEINKFKKMLEKKKWKLNKGKKQIQLGNAYTRNMGVNDWHKLHNKALEELKEELSD